MTDKKTLQHDTQQVTPRDEVAIKVSLIESDEDIKKREKRSENLPLLYPQHTKKGEPYERYTFINPKPDSARPLAGNVDWRRIRVLGLAFTLSFLAVVGAISLINSIVKSLGV